VSDERRSSLHAALEDFVAAAGSPDAATLERMISHHPQHAAELTDFAVEWALQEGLPASADAGPADDERLIAAALERLRARLGPAGGRPPADPFARRSATELRALAHRLDLDLSLLAKLRHRRIVADSVPRGLIRALAAALEVPLAAIEAHLAAPPAIASDARFKAAQKPRAERQETFAEAVRRSRLDPGTRERWLASC